MIAASLTVVLAVFTLAFWREALIAHRERHDDDSSGVFIAVGSMFAYAAILVSGVAGL